MSRYWYVATKYSMHRAGLDAAFDDACDAAVTLTKAGLSVYSPIVHTHCIATRGNINPLDHDFWLAVDDPLMQAAAGLIVVMMPGWKESRGVTEEIAYFRAAKKPIMYLEWEDGR